MGRHHLMLIRLTAIGALIKQRAGAGADVLALVTFASRALADEVAAMLTKIVAPRIGVVAGPQFIEDSGLPFTLHE